MGKILVRRKQLRWWHFWKHCIRQIKSQHATLLKRQRSAKARSLHGRPTHARAPCPHAVVVAPARDHIGVGGFHGVRLFARLAFFSKRFPKPYPQLAACRIHEWTLFSVDCRRVSSCHTRSSGTHDSYDEASSADDRCCSASSGGGARISTGVRVTEAFH